MNIQQLPAGVLGYTNQLDIVVKNPEGKLVLMETSKLGLPAHQLSTLVSRMCTTPAVTVS